MSPAVGKVPANVVYKIKKVAARMEKAETTVYSKNGNGTMTTLCRLETRLGNFVNHDEDHVAFMFDGKMMDVNPQNGEVLSFDGDFLSMAAKRASKILDIAMTKFNRKSEVKKGYIEFGFFSEENINRLLAIAEGSGKN